VGVSADVEHAVGALGAAVLHDGGRGGDDVGLVESGVQGGAAVTGGAEDHALLRHSRVRDEVVVGVDDLIDVDQVFGTCRLSSSWVHASSVARPISAVRSLSRKMDDGGSA